MINNFNSKRGGVAWAVDINLLAFKEEVTRLCGVDTRDTFNQRTFTGTIVADECSYCTCVCIKVNILKNMYWSKRFVNSSQRKNWIAHVELLAWFISDLVNVLRLSSETITLKDYLSQK